MTAFVRAKQRIKIMKPYIAVVTLGVANLEESVAFYRDGLGLKPTVSEEFEYEQLLFLSYKTIEACALAQKIFLRTQT